MMNMEDGINKIDSLRLLSWLSLNFYRNFRLIQSLNFPNKIQSKFLWRIKSLETIHFVINPPLQFHQNHRIKMHMYFAFCSEEITEERLSLTSYF